MCYFQKYHQYISGSYTLFWRHIVGRSGVNQRLQIGNRVALGEAKVIEQTVNDIYLINFTALPNGIYLEDFQDQWFNYQP